MRAPPLGRGRRILVIGYGNPGRRDDGLGPAFGARLEALRLPGVTVEVDYQLAIEHSQLAAQHDVVVFVDAEVGIGGDAPFRLRTLQAEPAVSPFSHSISPGAVLHLATECFGARPSGWLLGIRAVDLESFAEGLSAEGRANLAAALDAFCEAVNSGGLVHQQGQG